MTYFLESTLTAKNTTIDSMPSAPRMSPLINTAFFLVQEYISIVNGVAMLENNIKGINILSSLP